MATEAHQAMSKDTPMLVIQQEEHMSKASVARLYEMANEWGKELGVKVVVIGKGMSAKLEHGNADIVAALHEQSAAISRLADSNQQVIDYLLSEEVAEAGDVEGSHTRYLDPDEE